MAKKPTSKPAKKTKSPSGGKSSKPRVAAGKARDRKTSPKGRPAPRKANGASKPTKASKSARPAAPAKSTKPAKVLGPAKPVPVTKLRPQAIKPKPQAPMIAAAEPDEDEEAPAIVEPPLTPEEIEEFRELLVMKRAQILGDMTTLQNEALNKNRRDASGDLSSMPIHMADLGSDNYELEFTLGLIEGERSTLREIEEALERIKKGTYGVCEATGKPIGKARLRARPWARYCYEYTLQLEKSGQIRRS